MEGGELEDDDEDEGESETAHLDGCCSPASRQVPWKANGLVQLVIGFHSDKKEMPKEWNDLTPYYSSSSPHHDGLSFEEIKAKITINFPELPKLALSYPDKSKIPDLIQAVSGIQSHWDGAEPNRLVNCEINKTKMPNQ